jgi:serine/threonine protein kinase
MVGMQLGHFRLLRLIGSGSMGEVYLAEDMRITRYVAIKVVRTEATSYPDTNATRDVTRLFLRELSAIAALDHPHILPFIDFGEENVAGKTITFMVMPYREEGSLVDWLRRRDNAEVLSLEETAHFISQAADALQYAHDHQLIHQDVKPSNFLIRSRTKDPNHPDLMLVDFGIAKFTNAAASASQSIRGTPAYMAPEQWDSEPVYATDQYALAVMAYQLLTSHTPFQGRMEQVMWQHFNMQPQAPSTLNTRISPAIDEVILRALAKKAEERFASIADFSCAFQEPLHSIRTEEIAVLSSRQRDEHTFISDTKPKASLVGQKLLLLGLILLLILENIGFILYVTISRQIIPFPIHVTSSATFTATFIANNLSFNPYISKREKMVLNDPLSNNSKGYGWDYHPLDSFGGACQFAKDGYHVIEQQNYVNECHSTTQLGNFTFEVQMKVIKGNCGGFTFRDNLSISAYHFEVCQDGTYQLYRYGPSNTATTLTYDSSSAIKTGLNQTNLIAVVAIDNKFDLYVNRQNIANASDNTYHQGYIGLRAVYHNGPVEVVYSYANAWTP